MKEMDKTWTLLAKSQGFHYSEDGRWDESLQLAKNLLISPPPLPPLHPPTCKKHCFCTIFVLISYFTL